MKHQILVLFVSLFSVIGCNKPSIDSAPAPAPPPGPQSDPPEGPRGSKPPDAKLPEAKPPGNNPPTLPKIDWAQPPVACAEEIIPHKAQRVCLDLSSIQNIYLDWPLDISDEDKAYWQSHPRGTSYCRAQELLRREEQTPGTYPAGDVETAWMRALAVENSDLKIAAVYEASKAHGMPTQVLAGALFQESLFAQLGIASDGGNYSCGIGQTNIAEWCNWAVKQSENKKIEMRFPLAVRKCDQAQLSFVKPFYEIALTNLAGLPEYKLMPVHFEGILLEQVEGSFPAADPLIQQIRFDLVKSFLGNCRDAKDGIAAKANQLAVIYSTQVPKGLKSLDTYPVSEHYKRACRGGGEEKFYPLSNAWMLAVGIYNAGPRAVDAMAFYNRWTKEHLELSGTFADFNPVEMVNSFYWGGRYSAVDDKIHFLGRNGNDLTWDWFKGCVLQRHIARVAQHVTLRGTPKFIDSLENGISCKKASIDPVTGERISGVPDFRQIPSGQR